ncbi:MAG: fructosamine kinase family protein [Verrucomicrobiota bacterium]
MSIAQCTELPDIVRRSGGGCIHQAWTIGKEDRRFFLKTSGCEQSSVYRAEADGLNQLRAALKHSAPIRVPEVLGHFSGEAFSCLVLEFIEMSHAGDETALADGLVKLHRNTANSFGLEYDNTIGSTPQSNKPCDSWLIFFKTRRLEPQLEWAREHGFVFSGVDRLLDEIEGFFPDYQPTPSLLHGDLWGGNVGYDARGVPVIFDPAIYYGDREADLAFTEVFGGFSRRFYESYREKWPLSTGYAKRKDLYNLYHMLNHVNLFGASYADSVESLIHRLIH